MIQNYDDAINYIHGRNKWAKKNTFARIDDLLEALGNPQDQLKYVHITGTNGKGSVARMTEQLLLEHGLKVGLFTSPFIMRFNERIQINNKPISDQDLTRIMQRMEPILIKLDQTLPDGGPTEFETLTALMFVYFAQQNLDVVVLEVGIGGTWDTTNVIKNKLVAVITTIGLDHQKVLGNTVTEIAKQKAGIIKNQNQITVVGRLPELTIPVISKQTEHLYQLEMQFKLKKITQNDDGDWIFDWYDQQGRRFENLKLALLGNYQLDNVSVALETAALALQALNVTMQLELIQKALMKVEWPARFEKINQNTEIVLDGAHNLAGIQALIQTIQQRYFEQPVVVIIGVLSDKNYLKMLNELAKEPQIRVIVVSFTAPNQRAAIDPQTVVDELSIANIKAEDDWEIALNKELLQDPVAKIIISGSLYFVAEVRQIWSQKHII